MTASIGLVLQDFIMELYWAVPAHGARERVLSRCEDLLLEHPHLRDDLDEHELQRLLQALRDLVLLDSLTPDDSVQDVWRRFTRVFATRHCHVPPLVP